MGRRGKQCVFVIEHYHVGGVVSGASTAHKTSYPSHGWVGWPNLVLQSGQTMDDRQVGVIVQDRDEHLQVAVRTQCFCDHFRGRGLLLEGPILSGLSLVLKPGTGGAVQRGAVRSSLFFFLLGRLGCLDNCGLFPFLCLFGPILALDQSAGRRRLTDTGSFRTDWRRCGSHDIDGPRGCRCNDHMGDDRQGCRGDTRPALGRRGLTCATGLHSRKSLLIGTDGREDGLSGPVRFHPPCGRTGACRRLPSFRDGRGICQEKLGVDGGGTSGRLHAVVT